MKANNFLWTTRGIIFFLLSWVHRIIDDRIEKYDAYVIVFSKQDCRNEECLSRSRVESRGRGPGCMVLPQRTLRPRLFPIPGRVWGAYVVCGCCRASTTARANPLTRLCRIGLPFILFSILSSIILWLGPNYFTQIFCFLFSSFLSFAYIEMMNICASQAILTRLTTFKFF